ncbi:MAG: hypothetical protein ABJN34_16850 [Litoreibacter sp.]|uniref:hypothetical protein n=1 Tax=Litoreibacter sp. TaxID=1969459 RepID=UPI003298D7BD
MFKKASIAVGMMLALAAPAVAQQELKAAMVAAMGEAIEDDRYPGVITKYGLPAPDLSNPTLVNSRDHPYPEATEGSLLSHVLNTKSFRIGWIGVGAPWAIPSEADASIPEGLSVDYWHIMLEKLNNHYDTDIKLDWVEYTDSAGNNDMYRWLATSDDLDCTAEGREVNGCYDVIGGAYAINKRRKGISDISPAYYPLNMSVVRTNVPLPDGVGPLNTADEIRAAMADPKINIVLAGLPDTGEDSILSNFTKEYGDTFTHIDRTPGSKVMEFAQDSKEAHFVLGTNVRMASMRFSLPELCSNCDIIPNLTIFGGVGFATALTE